MISKTELRIEALRLAVSQGGSDEKYIVSRAKVFYDFLSEGYKEIDNQRNVTMVPVGLASQYSNMPNLIPRTNQHTNRFGFNTCECYKRDGRSYI